MAVLCRLTLKNEVIASALCPNLTLWQIRDLPLNEHDKRSNARYGIKAF
jgi:hypothetical protein